MINSIELAVRELLRKMHAGAGRVIRQGATSGRANFKRSVSDSVGVFHRCDTATCMLVRM